MKRLISIFAVLALLVSVSVPVSVFAAGDKAKGEIVMKVGNKVHLFHSGTADVRKDICLKDVIPVYRESMRHRTQKGTPEMVSKEVGQVKVLSYVGDHYFEAEVVKGEVKVGDIAMKAGAACLVQPAM